MVIQSLVCLIKTPFVDAIARQSDNFIGTQKVWAPHRSCRTNPINNRPRKISIRVWQRTSQRQYLTYYRGCIDTYLVSQKLCAGWWSGNLFVVFAALCLTDQALHFRILWWILILLLSIILFRMLHRLFMRRCPPSIHLLNRSTSSSDYLPVSP